MYLGDYQVDYADLNFKFTSRTTAGVPSTLGPTGSPQAGPTVSVYKSNGAVQTTSGVTITADFDSITGLNNVKIDLSAGGSPDFYVAGEDYSVVLEVGTVNGVNVAGEVLATFSIENRTVSGLNDPTAAAIADAVWDELTSGHNVGGSFGKAVRQVKEAIVSVESTVNDASATTTSFVTALTEATSSHYSDLTLVFIDGALVGQAKPIQSYDGGTKTVTLDEALTEAPANGDAFIILTTHIHPVSQIADAVLDEALSGHSTAGSLGKAITDIEADTNELQTDLTNGGRLDLILDELTSQGDTNESKLDTIDAIVDAILVDTGTTLPATLTTIEGKIDTIDAIVDAILVDTGTDLPATLATIAGYIDTEITTLITNLATLQTTVDALNDISAADVNAQVLDVLNVDTFAELGAVPAATSSIVSKLTFLFMLARNKVTQTDSQQELFADDGSTSVATAAISDSGSPRTFQKGEFS